MTSVLGERDNCSEQASPANDFPSDRIRVLLIDDHPVVRWGFRQIVSNLAPDIEVVADVATASDALRELLQASIDVVILDVNLDGRSGLELLDRIRKEHPHAKILVYTRYQEQDFAIRAFKAGALGYINKDQQPSELIRAVREVASGDPYVSLTAARLLRGALSDDSTRLPHCRLTRREDEVFRMLIRGDSVTHISKQLNLSVKTISTHRTNILEKLNARNLADLIRYAIDNKLD